MRILILLSSLLAATFQPITPNDELVDSEPTGPEKPAVAVKNPNETTPLLDVDYTLLTQGGWKIVSIIADKPCDVNGDGYETTDIMSETPTCALDDVMHINADHTVSFDRHQRCVASEKPVETYKWKLAKDGTFTIIDGSIEAKMQLKSVNSSRMVMWIPMEESGEIYHFKVTYGQTTKQIPGKILKN